MSKERVWKQNPNIDDGLHEAELKLNTVETTSFFHTVLCSSLNTLRDVSSDHADELAS